MKNTYIIHYSQQEEKFVIHTRPGSDIPEPIDQIILKNVIFFISPTVPQIIRERAKTMTRSEAKFPHAFAISNEREPNMDKEKDLSLVWEDFEYNVLAHNDFVTTTTQEPIKVASYLMIRGRELRIVR